MLFLHWTKFVKGDRGDNTENKCCYAVIIKILGVQLFLKITYIKQFTYNKIVNVLELCYNFLLIFSIYWNTN